MSVNLFSLVAAARNMRRQRAHGKLYASSWSCANRRVELVSRYPAEAASDDPPEQAMMREAIESRARNAGRPRAASTIIG